ncbi:MAG TPA: hypothetical protein VHL59_10405 [Thermoanaerobaculia bacterium]|nr:hypothetical protein [Thermoanaerobaculia bacterium]
MNLENDPSTALRTSLKRALRREAPPAGFAGRVMERIERPPRTRPVWWRAAAASLTLAAVLGGYVTHRVVEQRRGERAREEVLRALSIAGEKVRYAQQEVRDIGSH